MTEEDEFSELMSEAGDRRRVRRNAIIWTVILCAVVWLCFGRAIWGILS
jgi:hypothetical protein